MELVLFIGGIATVALLGLGYWVVFILIPKMIGAAVAAPIWAVKKARKAMQPEALALNIRKGYEGVVGTAQGAVAGTKSWADRFKTAWDSSHPEEYISGDLGPQDDGV